MATEPVRSTAVAAAPKDYSIPGAQVIRLLSARASFTDNGAAGDWLPALQVLDNNGNVLVTAADQGVKVTAGSDADVSWFPGVKARAAATPGGGGISYARGYSNHSAGDPNILVNNGTQKAAPFAHVSTSNAAVMNWTTTTNPNDTLQLLGTGIYLVNGSSQSDLGGGIITPLIYAINGGQGTEVPNMSFDNLNSPAVVDPSGFPGDLCYAIVSTVNVGANLQLLLENASGGNRNCTLAAMGVIFYGNPA